MLNSKVESSHRFGLSSSDVRLGIARPNFQQSKESRSARLCCVELELQATRVKVADRTLRHPKLFAEPIERNKEGLRALKMIQLEV